MATLSDTVKQRIEALVDKRLVTLQKEIPNQPLTLYLLYDYLKRYIVSKNLDTFYNLFLNKSMLAFSDQVFNSESLKTKISEVIKVNLTETVRNQLARIVSNVNEDIIFDLTVDVKQLIDDHQLLSESNMNTLLLQESSLQNKRLHKQNRLSLLNFYFDDNTQTTYVNTNIPQQHGAFPIQLIDNTFSENDIVPNVFLYIWIDKISTGANIINFKIRFKNTANFKVYVSMFSTRSDNSDATYIFPAIHELMSVADSQGEGVFLVQVNTEQTPQAVQSVESKTFFTMLAYTEENL